MSVLMAILLRPSRPPHWAMLAVLVSLAFVISIVWLNIIANEVVGVLTALGLLLNIKTGQELLLYEDRIVKQVLSLLYIPSGLLYCTFFLQICFHVSNVYCLFICMYSYPGSNGFGSW